MSVFQSFQTGLALGQEQRKERDRTAAQSSAAELFKIGNYEGAESALIGIGDYQGADAYASAGKRRKDAEKQKTYGEAFKTGGATGLMDTAGAQGDFETYSVAQGIDDSKVTRERQTKTWAKEDYQQGIAYLAQSAASLKGYPIEERGALALQALEQTPYAQDPQVRAAIERAAADGRITDEELDAFEQQMLSAGERMQQENWQATFDQNELEANRSYELGKGNLAVSQAELELRRKEAAASPKRETREDQNGVLRYLDNGQPVFPDVTTTPEPAKPLIGSEAFARVATGLPNAKKAVQDLETLIFDSKGTLLSQPGYEPGRDFGAGVVQDLGHFPVVGGVVRGITDPLSRTLGGKDYQMFEDSYGAFEGAMLPIISGAAITETEALRQMKALRINAGDGEDTKRRKIDAMKTMVRGVEMAARGDTEGFLGMLDQVGETSGAGPVARGGTTATPAPKPTGKVAPEFEGYTLDGDPITEDDIQTTMRENGMTREQVVAALMGDGQ